MRFNFESLKFQIAESKYFWFLFKLVCGILLILFSGVFVNIVSIIVGIVLLIMGIIGTIDYFSYLKHKYDNNKLLFKPLFMAIVGAVFVLAPHLFVSLIAFIVGTFLFVMGLIKFQYYLRFKNTNSFWWWVTTIVSAVLMLFGAMIVFFPRYSVNTILVFGGIGLIINAIQDISDKFSKSGKKLFGKY